MHIGAAWALTAVTFAYAIPIVVFEPYRRWAVFQTSMASTAADSIAAAAFIAVTGAAASPFYPLYYLIIAAVAMRFELRQALAERGPWDVVLSDWRMPRFEAPEALAIFQELEHRQGVAETQAHLADAYSGQGRYRDAYQALQGSLEISGEIGVEHDLARARTQLGHYFVTVGQFDEAEKELTEARRLAERAHARDLLSLIFLGRARLGRFQGTMGDAETAGESAKRQADLIGQKEISLRADLELGRISLERGQLARAEKLFSTVREDASRIGAQPILAEANAALGQVRLAGGDAGSAYASSQEAIAIAERFSGRPLLLVVNATLAEACRVQGRDPEALDAYSRVAASLNWIETSLPGDQVEGFMLRSDVQLLLGSAVRALEEKGRGQELSSLARWVSKKKANSGKPLLAGKSNES